MAGYPAAPRIALIHANRLPPMRRRSLTSVSIGLLWLVSLGVCFVLGLLAAFAVHTRPDDAAQRTLAERQMALAVERVTGQPIDWQQFAERGPARGETPLAEPVRLTLDGLLTHSDTAESALDARHLVAGLPIRQLIAASHYVSRAQGAVNPAMRQQLLAALYRAWAVDDGRSALGHALKFEDAATRELALRAVLAGWAERMPLDAWNWVVGQQADSAELRAERLALVLWEVAESNLEQAFAWMRALPARSVEQAVLADLLAAFMLETRPASDALAWLGEWPAGDLRVAATQRIVRRWAVTDPEAALRWGAQSLAADFAETQARIVATWAQRDAGAAARWVWQLPAGPVRGSALAAVAEQWIEGEGAGRLAAWLNAMPSHPDLDPAIRAVAFATFEQDPATALSWAQVLSQPGDRLFVEAVIARHWLARDANSLFNALAGGQVALSADARHLLFGEVDLQLDAVPAAARADEYELEAGTRVELMAPLPDPADDGERDPEFEPEFETEFEPSDD
jgi:hypothetical protein